jgi:hypothetical protein
MARYLHRTCPRCNGYVGIVLREPGRNTPLQAVNGHCLECGYRLAWLMIHSKQVSRTVSLFAWRKTHRKRGVQPLRIFRENSTYCCVVEELESKTKVQVANLFNRSTDIPTQEVVHLFAECGVIELKISRISYIIQGHCNDHGVKRVATVVDLFQDTHFAAQRSLVSSGDSPFRRPITNPALTHQGVVSELHIST